MARAVCLPSLSVQLDDIPTAGERPNAIVSSDEHCRSDTAAISRHSLLFLYRLLVEYSVLAVAVCLSAFPSMSDRPPQLDFKTKGSFPYKTLTERMPGMELIICSH